jgi:polysaccharide biosynthesis protein PslH
MLAAEWHQRSSETRVRRTRTCTLAKQPVRILYVTGQSPWPPVVGSRIRSYNILRMLERNNDVTVALLNGTTEEVAAFRSDVQHSAVEVVPRIDLPRWRKCQTLTLQRYRRVFKSQTYGAFRQGLRALVEREQPDVLWFFRFNTVWNAGCDRYEIPVVCDVDDFESKAYGRAIQILPRIKRTAATLDYPWFVRAQGAVTRACDLLLVSNPEDVAEVAAATGRPVQVAPNGYDYSNAPDFDRQRRRRIVFYGSLWYEPNVDALRWFVRNVWPGIRKALPDVQLEVAGTLNPGVQVLDREPGVHLCGFVESIHSFVNDAALLVVPLRMGGGTRIKILEAWALGLPVVSTTLGCEGLDAADGETLMVADDPDEFCKACIELITSPRKGRDMAQRAFEFARPRFDWSVLAPRLEMALRSVVREPQDSATGRGL